MSYKGHGVAQCSKCTAISLTVFIFSVIFLSSLSLAFIRPFDFSHECPSLDVEFVETKETDDYYDYDEEEDLIATNGEPFPWDDIRLPKFITPVRYDIELTPNLTSLWVRGEIIWPFYRKFLLKVGTLRRLKHLTPFTTLI